MKAVLRDAFGASLLLVVLAAHAQQVCELNGAHINPNHGGMTAGKTGLMRCRDGEGGPVVREQELQNGRFMGIVRYFEKGVLKREHSVNERGNRDGLAREYAGTPGNNPLLREETYRNGDTVGIARSWHASGQLRRVTFYDEKGREQAYAEFTQKGQLRELRCGDRPLLVPHADDAAWCGHGGGARVVPLYGEDGRTRGSDTYERGERVKSESLWENGKPQRQIDITTTGGAERQFANDGTKRKEVEWIYKGGNKRERYITLEREYHESGKLTRERRFAPGERGSQLQLEQTWYLNGQPRAKTEYVAAEGKTQQRETRFHDNGQPAFEGGYLIVERNRELPSGVHKLFDANGRLRREQHYDARGRIAREREFDDDGRLTRDDEVFEDGSRKSHAR